jgi:hypothetical protein
MIVRWQTVVRRQTVFRRPMILRWQLLELTTDVPDIALEEAA